MSGLNTNLRPNIITGMQNGVVFMATIVFRAQFVCRWNLSATMPVVEIRVCMCMNMDAYIYMFLGRGRVYCAMGNVGWGSDRQTEIK